MVQLAINAQIFNILSKQLKSNRKNYTKPILEAKRFRILFLLTVLVFTCNASLLDFCVVDLKAPEGPAGYSCKNPGSVTVDNFVFFDLASLETPPTLSMLPTFAAQYPRLNGIGLSIARLDLAPGGKIPMHTHPGASKLLFVVQGSIVTTFISSANKVYLKKLKKGDLMVFPQGLLHFR